MKSLNPSPTWRFRVAFSLIELLAVIAVLGILVSLALPAIGSLLGSSGVMSAGDAVVASFSQARQLAASRNRTVEVRLYKYNDPTRPGQPADGRFQAMQLFLLEPSPTGTSTNAAGRKVSLPATTFFASSPALSSLLDSSKVSQITGTTLGQAVPPFGQNYTAATFQIFPDGSTSLPSGSPLYLTIVPSTTPDDSATPPSNFATILVQPIGAKAKLHRP